MLYRSNKLYTLLTKSLGSKNERKLKRKQCQNTRFMGIWKSVKHCVIYLHLRRNFFVLSIRKSLNKMMRGKISCCEIDGIQSSPAFLMWIFTHLFNLPTTLKSGRMSGCRIPLSYCRLSRYVWRILKHFTTYIPTLKLVPRYFSVLLLLLISF